MQRTIGLSRRQVMIGSTLLATGMTGISSGTIGAATVHGSVFHDRSGAGSRRPGDPGIANVLVSNGVDVVRTDAKGRWLLPASDVSHVFVIKPTGWRVPNGPVGLPRFWRCIPGPAEGASVVTVSRHESSIDFALHPSPESISFEAALVADTQPQSHLELDYLRDTVLAAIAGTGAGFVINHGDIVFDDLSLYPRYLQLVAATRLPWHHTPGNHDMNHVDHVNGDCFETWQAVFGPTAYAFQQGRATFILLNNVERLPPGELTTTGYDYRGAIGAGQLHFVRNLLRHVPADDLIVLSMHIPLVGFEDPNDPAGHTADRRELLHLLTGRPHCVSFAGHTHTTEHHYLGEEDGFGGPGRHHHHVLTAASGSWWSGPLDYLGVPLALSRDGTPKGFHLLNVDGNRYTTRFVPVGPSAQTQMCIGVTVDETMTAAATSTIPLRMVPNSSLPVGRLTNASLVVNVFDGGPRTKVSYQVGSAAVVAPIAMRRIAMQDPFTVDVYARNQLALKPWVEPAKSSHVWRAPLPADLAPGVHRVIVIVRDEYERQHTAASIIEIVALGA
jgi:C terminal of Calcineurin-like phosphoesterase/N terminal of Calcineurin-like phosphoesterase/Calcineurin-like phosphoesterase